MPPGSNFRLNIDFLLERKIVTGEIFLVSREPGKNFPDPAIFARWSGQITPLFDKNTKEKSRKCAEILCFSAIQKMANKDEWRKRSRHGMTARF
jgi:hypothetical protein